MIPENLTAKQHLSWLIIVLHGLHLILTLFMLVALCGFAFESFSDSRLGEVIEFPEKLKADGWYFVFLTILIAIGLHASSRAISRKKWPVSGYLINAFVIVLTTLWYWLSSSALRGNP